MPISGAKIRSKRYPANRRAATDARLNTDSAVMATARSVPLSVVMGTTWDISPKVAVETRKIDTHSSQNCRYVLAMDHSDSPAIVPRARASSLSRSCSAGIFVTNAYTAAGITVHRAPMITKVLLQPTSPRKNSAR